MKELTNFVFKIIIALTIVCCANRGTPTGGEIDEVAPSIIKSTPENYTLNFNSKEIRVYFDEYIKFKNLQKYLIIWMLGLINIFVLKDYPEYKKQKSNDPLSKRATNSI